MHNICPQGSNEKQRKWWRYRVASLWTILCSIKVNYLQMDILRLHRLYGLWQNWYHVVTFCVLRWFGCVRKMWYGLQQSLLWRDRFCRLTCVDQTPHQMDVSIDKVLVAQSAVAFYWNYNDLSSTKHAFHCATHWNCFIDIFQRTIFPCRDSNSNYEVYC